MWRGWRPERAGSHNLHDDPVDDFGRPVDFPSAHRIWVKSSRPETKQTSWWPSTSTAIRSISAPCEMGGVLLYDSDNVQPDPNKKQFVHVGVPITG